MAGRGGNWGPGGSRTLKPDLELLEPMSIILLIRRTFMSLPPEGRINPGRDHGAEKSVLIRPSYGWEDRDTVTQTVPPFMEDTVYHKS